MVPRSCKLQTDHSCIVADQQPHHIARSAAAHNATLAMRYPSIATIQAMLILTEQEAANLGMSILVARDEPGSRNGTTLDDPLVAPDIKGNLALVAVIAPILALLIVGGIWGWRRYRKECAR